MLQINSQTFSGLNLRNISSAMKIITAVITIQPTATPPTKPAENELDLSFICCRAPANN